MPANTLGAVDVPLDLFSGLNTELAPQDLPEGVSPDNQDVVYVPGSVSSRPGMKKLLATPLPNNVTIVYQKTFIRQNGQPVNYYLDSAGGFWVEDVVNSPGSRGLFFTFPTGITQAVSVSAFGREYLACSDGLHGAHVPLQLTEITAPGGAFSISADRVSQDGPGANTSFPFDDNNFALIATITAISNIATVTLTLPIGNPALVPIIGDQVVIGANTVPAYNGTWTVYSVISNQSFQFQLGSTPAAGAGGNAVINGLSAPGLHKLVWLFQTRTGYVTAPSPPVTWNSKGSTRVTINSVPIGPSNVIARIAAFTGAGGSNYFYIPVTPFGADPSGNTTRIGTSTVVLDNTSTQATFDFSDNTLFSGIAIDIPGNNLFAQVVLDQCLGVSSYADRMVWFGERNKIQNFRNMGFEGGFDPLTPTAPLGWKVNHPGGLLAISGAWNSGSCWLIIGDGTLNQRGEVLQSAYQDYNGVAILQPSTQYSFKLWAQIFPAASPVNGSIQVDLSSLSSGLFINVQVPLASISQSAAGGYVTGDFPFLTPSTIPTDFNLSISEIGLNNGLQLRIDEIEIFPTLQPFNDTNARISYVNAPEQFDGVTGVLGSSVDDTAIKGVHVLRDNLYLHTSRLHLTQDNGTGEPATWSVREMAQRVGLVGPRAIDTGEDWAIWATSSGLRVFDGGVPYKVSQEIQTIWDSINPAAFQTMWVKNDSANRRVYIGAPIGNATAPNQVLAMDYRELDSASQLSSDSTIHISYAGKMIASDIARKWTRWNVTANVGEILYRSQFKSEFCVGAGSGETPGLSAGTGNIYRFDASAFTDDDYGQIASYYVTSAFVSHDQEQALGVGSHRKLYVYFAMFITGIGKIIVTPLVDTLTNPVLPTPAYPLSLTPNHDLEWPLNIDGERVFFKLQAIPLIGQTNNYFNTGKLIVTFKQHPMSPVRGLI